MQEKASEVLKPSIQSTSLGIKRASLHRQTASSKRRSELVWPEHGWQRNCSGPLLSGWPHWGAVPRSIPDRWLSGESGLPGQEAADTENTPIPGTWQPWPLASEGLVHPGTKQPLSSQAAHRWKGGNAFLPSPPTRHAGSWISWINSEPPACLLVSGQTSLSLDELRLIHDCAFTDNSLGLLKGGLPECTVAIPKPVNSDIFLGLFHPAKHSVLSEFKKSISGPSFSF